MILFVNLNWIKFVVRKYFIIFFYLFKDFLVSEILLIDICIYIVVFNLNK